MKQIIPIVTLLTTCLLFGCEESIVPDEEKIELVEEIVEVDSLICDEDSLIIIQNNEQKL
jgi:hypothetical protein